MKRTMYQATALIIVAATAAWTPSVVYSGGAEGGPTSEVPELDVLKDLAGKWKGDFVVGAARTPWTTLSTAEWQLKGRFLVTRGESKSLSQPGTLETLMTWTYDPNKKEYRRWMFSSGGALLEENGRFDASTKTFHFESSNDAVGSSSVSTIQIVDPNTIRWTIGLKKNGEVVIRIEGTNRRDL